MSKKGKLLKIYLNESDSYHIDALYHVLIEKIKKYGLAGATTVKGVEGFGNSQIIYCSKVFCIKEDLPIIIEVVDFEDKIYGFIDTIKDIAANGLMITLQDVEFVKFSEYQDKHS